MKRTLNGVWQFKQENENEWLNATVPGCNYLDLLNLGKIPDPFDSTNEKDVYWVSEKNWEYTKTFTVSESELSYDKINLVCKMLDTICDVYLNEKLIGSGENCHIEYIFDVKDYLIDGENTIRIFFKSPVNFVKEKQAAEKTPANNNGQNGIPHIRKPQCHFGWDWGPVLPPSGIQKDIYLDFINIAEIKDVLISQEHTDGTVKIKTNVELDNFSNSDLKVNVQITAPNGEILEADGSDTEIIIKKPELWWTNDLSDKKEQPLYTIDVIILNNDNEIDRVTKKIGLRTIVLNRDKDEYGYNFQFVLNGVPLFIKGNNWIPADSFITRFDDKKLQYYIDATLFSNMNMIRVWGGGYYESDEFYDACDKYGILIWQDFCFACQPYPFFLEDFRKNVFNEVEYNVKRLRHHASLALWNGNNEIESMSTAWLAYRKYVKWTDIFFYEMLEDEIRKYDGLTSYIPGSPCGISHNNGHDKDNVGDTHLWAVWHGLQPMNYYRKRLTRFCSEFGFESLPDIKTIKTFATEKDYSLTSEVFTAHQKCNSGNMKMMYYIASRFRLPKNFEDFIYLSQVAQQECISDATEHWRRHRGRCNGAIYWQLNDCWPVCSWASIDYYGNYKALQYTSRHFNAPLSVSIEDTKDDIKIFAINDLNNNKEITVKFKLVDFINGVLNEQEVNTSINKLNVKRIFTLNLKKLKAKYDLKNTVLVAELYERNSLISKKTLLFYKEKDLILPKADLSSNIQIKDSELEITVSSDTFARIVRVESSLSTLPFSDNYFDIMPNESVTITLPLDDKFTAEELINSISLFSADKIIPDGKPIKDKMKKAYAFMQPINIANWVYQRNIPKDYKD